MNVLDKMEALSDDLKAYFNTHVELVKLQALDHSSSLGARIVSGVIIGAVIMLFVVFASTCLALYLSVLLGAYYIGFGIVAGIYLIAGIVFFASRKKILVDPIRDMIVARAMESETPPEER